MPAQPRALGRGGRTAITAISAALLVAAGAGVGLFIADDGEGHAHDVSTSAMGADMGAGHHRDGGSAAADPARKAWAEQHGQAISAMSNVPDVASATPGQQAAAADLLARTEAGTARYSDIAAAKAAGYDLDAGLASAEQFRPHLQEQMKAVDAGQTPKRIPMVHVANKANLRDAKILDPNAPEVLMYEYAGQNSWKLVGVMYTANEAYPDAPPDPGGPITRWHYHDNLLGQALMMHIFFVPGDDLTHAFALHMEGM